MIKIVKFCTGFLMVLFLISAAGAADSSDAPKAEALPLRFEADLLEAFSQEHRILLTGHVKASQGDWTLSAEQMVIEYADTEKAQTGPDAPEETGPLSRATREIETLTAEGSVVVTFQESVARTPKAIYHQKNGLLVLEGDGTVLTTPESRISGHRITLNRASGSISVERSANSPVEGFFTPSEAADFSSGSMLQ